MIKAKQAYLIREGRCFELVYVTEVEPGNMVSFVSLCPDSGEPHGYYSADMLSDAMPLSDALHAQAKTNYRAAKSKAKSRWMAKHKAVLAKYGEGK